MGALYGRKLKVTIGTGSEALVIEELDMDFSISANGDSNPNTMDLNIYNLSQASRGKITESGTDVTLEFYHDDGSPIILFKGDITEIEHKHPRPDRVSRIQASDGGKAITGSKFKKNYASGTTVSKVVTDIADTFGLSKVIESALPVRLDSADSFEGSSKKLMDRLASDYGFDWTINQGVLEITSVGMPPITRSVATLITPDTILLESPVRTDTGVQLKVLISSGILPKSIVSLQIPESRSVKISGGSSERIMDTSLNGTYIIDQIRYDGSNYDDRFDATVEALPYGG